MDAEKLGYLIAKVEELGSDFKDMKIKLEALEQQVHEKFKTVEITLKVVGWIGSGLLAVFTIPWSGLVAFVKRLLS